MAMEETTGTNKLVERILNDARADAEKTASETQEKLNVIQKELDAKLAGLKADFESKRSAAVKSVLDGCKTRASLDGRKEALTKKRAVIDRVFAETYQNMLGLDDATRKEICANLLKREAEDGDTVVPAGRDRENIAAVLKDWKGVKLSLSGDDAALEGGFLLVNEGYEKDCSFRSVLSELRDSEETDVAKRLFG